MKKNMMSVLILALLIVNIVLTSIMMFSVVGTARKTSALIDDITSAINLELDNQKGTATAGTVIEVPIENIEVYKIKCFNFLQKEREMLDSGEINIEDIS